MGSEHLRIIVHDENPDTDGERWPVNGRRAAAAAESRLAG